MSLEELQVGQLVEVHPKIDPNEDWNRLKGLAIVIDTIPDPQCVGLIEVRYVKPRGLPEEKLPIQTLVSSFSCVRV